MLLDYIVKCSVVADVMFRQDTTSEFQHMVDRVYKETSRHLLDVLNNKYKFLAHLKVRHDSPQNRSCTCFMIDELKLFRHILFNKLIA